MGFFGSIINAAFKVVITPLAIVADVANVLDGEKPDVTVKNTASAIRDVADAVDSVVEE